MIAPSGRPAYHDLTATPAGTRQGRRDEAPDSGAGRVTPTIVLYPFLEPVLLLGPTAGVIEQ